MKHSHRAVARFIGKRFGSRERPQAMNVTIARIRLRGAVPRKPQTNWWGVIRVSHVQPSTPAWGAPIVVTRMPANKTSRKMARMRRSPSLEMPLARSIRHGGEAWSTWRKGTPHSVWRNTVVPYAPKNYEGHPHAYHTKEN